MKERRHVAAQTPIETENRKPSQHRKFERPDTGLRLRKPLDRNSRVARLVSRNRRGRGIRSVNPGGMPRTAGARLSHRSRRRRACLQLAIRSARARSRQEASAPHPFRRLSHSCSPLRPSPVAQRASRFSPRHRPPPFRHQLRERRASANCLRGGSDCARAVETRSRDGLVKPGRARRGVAIVLVPDAAHRGERGGQDLARRRQTVVTLEAAQRVNGLRPERSVRRTAL